MATTARSWKMSTARLAGPGRVDVSPRPVEQLEDDGGRAQRHQEPVKTAGAAVTPPAIASRVTTAGEAHLEPAAADDQRPDAGQARERELDADREQQEDDADLGGDVHHLLVSTSPAGPARSRPRPAGSRRSARRAAGTTGTRSAPRRRRARPAGAGTRGRRSRQRGARHGCRMLPATRADAARRRRAAARRRPPRPASRTAWARPVPGGRPQERVELRARRRARSAASRWSGSRPGPAARTARCQGSRRPSATAQVVASASRPSRARAETSARPASASHRR